MKNFLSPIKIILLLLVYTISISSYSQDSKDYDVKSLDGVISALYASISGEIGEPRQWEMFYDLFAPDAKLIPTGKNPEGMTTYRYFTPQDYKEQAETYLVENGFHEIEVFRVKETYGPIVHLFSTYESRNSIEDEKPFNRGINSIQLMNDGERYWILNIFWSHESAENPLPAKYLPH